jgi:hypothetical protein
MRIYVSEERITSIFRVTGIGELGTLVVSSKLHMPRRNAKCETSVSMEYQIEDAERSGSNGSGHLQTHATTFYPHLSLQPQSRIEY